MSLAGSNPALSARNWKLEVRNWKLDGRFPISDLQLLISSFDFFPFLDYT